jgi:hypothetical protein
MVKKMEIEEEMGYEEESSAKIVPFDIERFAA